MNTLEIGLVTRPHGVRGELRLKLHFEASATLFDVARVRLEFDSGITRDYEVLGVRRAPKALLLRLAGVETCEQAEMLRGAKVLVDRAELVELGPDEYYLVDLVGCEVHGPSGVLGTVSRVSSHPTLDTIVILTNDQRELEQPLSDEWIERVSVAERVIVLASLDGLID